MVPSRSVALSVGACVATLGGVVVIMRRGSRAPAAPSWPGHSAKGLAAVRYLRILVRKRPVAVASEFRCSAPLSAFLVRSARRLPNAPAAGNLSAPMRPHSLRGRWAGGWRARSSFLPGPSTFFSVAIPTGGRRLRRRPAWSPWPCPCELSLPYCAVAEARSPQRLREENAA